MTTRTLGEADRAALHALTMQQPENNLFLLGNLESLGLDKPFCTFWGDFAADGSLRGVANRYFAGWSLYGQTDADWSALAALIDADNDAERLQDNPGAIASILPLLRRYRAAKVDVEELMRLEAIDFAPQPVPPGWRVQRATLADLDALAVFYADAGDMTRARAGTERPLRDGRVYLALDATGAIGAAALTNAETQTPPRLAMVGGVFTLPAQRGRGLAASVCSVLCASLLADGITPVLYWKHPAAGHIYRELGFQPIGTWRSVWLERIDGT